MSARPRRSPIAGALALALATLPACADPRDPLDLDLLEPPTRECVQVIHEALELGGQIHAYVGDRADSPGGWALTTQVADNQAQLALVRVPASDDEAPTDPVFLGLLPEDSEVVSLRAGASEGELWVLVDFGTVTMRRLVPELGELARNDSLANFPGFEGAGSACPTDFTRVMLLVEGLPYLLALPDCSDTPALVLHLLALDAETLGFLTNWQLAFDPCGAFDDPAACAELYAYTLESVGPARASLLPDLVRLPVGFTQVRAFDTGIGLEGELLSSDVSLLDLRLSAEGPQARLVTFREVWIHNVPLALGPVDLAQDPYSTLLQVRNELLQDDAVLMRFDTISDSYIQLRSPELLPLAGRGTLVQLDNQGAMLEIVDERLLAVALADVYSWPSWTTEELLRLEGLVAFEQGGAGQLLLRRAEDPPQVIQISCLEGT